MVEDDRSYHQHLAEAEAEAERAQATMLMNVLKVYYQLAEAYLQKIKINPSVEADAA